MGIATLIAVFIHMYFGDPPLDYHTFLYITVLLVGDWIIWQTRKTEASMY